MKKWIGTCFLQYSSEISLAAGQSTAHMSSRALNTFDCGSYHSDQISDFLGWCARKRSWHYVSSCSLVGYFVEIAWFEKICVWCFDLCSSGMGHVCLFLVRFKTNGEKLVGVEKLAIVEMDSAMLTKPYKPLPHLDRESFLRTIYILRTGHVFSVLIPDRHVSLHSNSRARGKLLHPFSVAFVKGWRRTLCAFIICEGIRKLQIPLDRVPGVFKETCIETIVTQ